MRVSREIKMANQVTITLTQLAAGLAEEHQLTKRAGRELLDNLVSLIEERRTNPNCRTRHIAG